MQGTTKAISFGRPSSLPNVVSARQAPALISILATQDASQGDDVIVPVVSQQYQVPTAQIVRYTNLAHTNLPVLGNLVFLGSNSDANVTNSTAVDAQLVSWLDGQSGASSASEPQQAQRQVATDASPIKHTDEEWKNWHAKTYTIADERLHAIIPAGDVELGHPR